MHSQQGDQRIYEYPARIRRMGVVVEKKIGYNGEAGSQRYLRDLAKVRTHESRGVTRKKGRLAAHEANWFVN